MSLRSRTYHRPEPIPGEPARDPFTEPDPDEAPGSAPHDSPESDDAPLE